MEAQNPDDDVHVSQFGAAVIVLGGTATGRKTVVTSGVRGERAELKGRAHAYRAHYAAVEAAEDDRSFSPEAVEIRRRDRALAGQLWRTGECAALDRLPRVLLSKPGTFAPIPAGSGLKVVGTASTELLRVVNRDDEDEDRIDARVRCTSTANTPGSAHCDALHRSRRALDIRATWRPLGRVLHGR